MSEYKAIVSGTTWEGFEGETSYTFDHKPTKREVLGSTGDFQTVSDIQLLKFETTVTPLVFADCDTEPLRIEPTPAKMREFIKLVAAGNTEFERLETLAKELVG